MTVQTPHLKESTTQLSTNEMTCHDTQTANKSKSETNTRGDRNVENNTPHKRMVSEKEKKDNDEEDHDDPTVTYLNLPTSSRESVMNKEQKESDDSTEENEDKANDVAYTSSENSGEDTHSRNGSEGSEESISHEESEATSVKPGPGRPKNAKPQESIVISSGPTDTKKRGRGRPRKISSTDIEVEALEPQSKHHDKGEALQEISVPVKNKDSRKDKLVSSQSQPIASTDENNKRKAEGPAVAKRKQKRADEVQGTGSIHANELLKSCLQHILGQSEKISTNLLYKQYNMLNLADTFPIPKNRDLTVQEKDRFKQELHENGVVDAMIMLWVWTHQDAKDHVMNLMKNING